MVEVKAISREEGRRMLDEQAREFLGMSAEECIRRYDAGELGYDDSEHHARVLMLIPLAR